MGTFEMSLDIGQIYLHASQLSLTLGLHQVELRAASIPIGTVLEASVVGPGPDGSVVLRISKMRPSDTQK